ncbi:PTS lactose/cellobiose transporter subunit IIA [Vibrio parahaemolyticus]|nr:PTS lactose/cellobiose transporter subunit IIA [Vibrio parahaemolyticus]EGQ8194987.1 PTS lactose/cellobiose transporter subunit IIA [Vibrio parahaemolyticus]
MTISETQLMSLITSAGMARSMAMEAFVSARTGDIDTAKALLAEAREASSEAHKIQTELIGMDEGEGKLHVTIVLVHAQDHLMNAMLCIDLATEMVELYRTIKEAK